MRRLALCALLLALASAHGAAKDEPVDELKTRFENARPEDRPDLAIEIARPTNRRWPGQLTNPSALSDAARQQLAKRVAGDDWNVLVSKLENELLQGRGNMAPEAYRRAIEQYFDEISRAKSTGKSP